MDTAELFAGIGGFRLAADRLGLKTIYANDFKSEACVVYRDRFGENVLEQGDIRECANKVPKHDVLTAGFPCQPFSAAGKKQGIRDPRGTLFQVIVEVLDRVKPKYFVLENVKRLLTMEHGAHFATILLALSELNYRIEWRLLNAKNFGLAQNRERLVICGMRNPEGSNNEPMLAHVSELPSMIGLFSSTRGNDWRPVEKHGSRFPEWGMVLNGQFFGETPERFLSEAETTLLRDVLEISPSSEYDYTDRMRDRLAANDLRNKFVHGVEILSNQSGGARMGYTIFGVRGLAPTLTASTSRHYERYCVDGRFRRLTPIEYARLQGFPDHHCSAVSTYTQYELYGNAVPPRLAEWAVSRVTGLTAAPEAFKEKRYA